MVARVDEDTGIPKVSREDGRILTKLRPHDFEFFDAEVWRYGPAKARRGLRLALAGATLTVTTIVPRDDRNRGLDVVMDCDATSAHGWST